MYPGPTPDVPSTAEPVPTASPVRAAVLDRRPSPQGGLPRQVQTWIMVGLAVVILGVIVITGRPEPMPGTPVSTPPNQTASIPPARVRSYQERLAEQEARLLQEAAAVPADAPMPFAPVASSPAPSESLDDERQRRDEQSLFADNVAFTRRTGEASNAATAQVGGRVVGDSNAAVPFASPTGPVASPAGDTSAPPLTNGRTSGPTEPRREVSAAMGEEVLETLLEGTLIETVLVNRLDGTFEGPVQGLVTTAVYSADRQSVVIPAGARVLGSAAPVQAWGDTRLAVRFHRLLLPNGRTHRLDVFPGLNQVGETGLRDQVNRHYLQVFGASLAIGAVAGLSQVGTRGGFDPSFGDAARQSAGASLATSTARVLDRYLNVLPTITIREGHRIKVMLTSDLRLPVYAPVSGSPGGL